MLRFQAWLKSDICEWNVVTSGSHSIPRHLPLALTLALATGIRGYVKRTCCYRFRVFSLPKCVLKALYM